ncbi:MAG: cytochrome d ubiquinol oxidase subunit II [Chloroflexi bacterium]|nr:MAG: cytochrome d ubiquinol oxidase subunit II [Chloroflexota bacterium]
MSEPEIVAGILLLALTAYAVLAGADFGGGVWDLLASGPRARDQRRAVAEAMGPVWEANHVWLIFMIVGLFTAFPSAFARLSLDLYVPFTIALIGIVLRGAAFAFRAHGREAAGDASAWGLAFGAASIVAPFSLAIGLAAVASASADRWATPFGVLLGVFAVSLCAYLAATYLTVEAEGTALESDFRRRAIASGLASGVLALACLGLAPGAAPSFAHSLLGRGLPLLILALVNGPVALVAVWRSRPRIARFAVAAQVTFVLWAWAVGQWPNLVPPDITIADAAAPPSVLTALLVVIGIGMALLLPSLWLLFRVFKTRTPAATY